MSKDIVSDPKKQAIVAMRKVAAKIEALERARTEPIAIIGMGCRFPGGADSPKKYWRLLRDGTDAVREIPEDRWDVDKYYDPDPKAEKKMYVREGGFLKEPIDRFDPEFFGISPREAKSIDPQQRLFLEVAWETLENAGQNAESLKKSQTGVFLGMMQNDYGQFGAYSRDLRGLDVYSGTGSGLCFSIGRLSYFLGLRGPSLVLDVACASSLAAAHLACQSLRSKECDLALAGGSQLILLPNFNVWLSMAGALSPDCRCKSFDAAANGYARGEGCGMIALKRLSDAQADGDNILALIRGSGVNHDGPSSGLTAPNEEAQAALINQVLKSAGLKSSQISYIETHGTGTSLGDPIEIEALKEVFAKDYSPGQTCWLGAVKSNIGHLEPSAGVAGIIKAVLCMRHNEIPPNLHFTKLNPHVDITNTPFKIPVETQKWPKGQNPRFAGVSAFGMGGTNSHIILEETPDVKTPEPKTDEAPPERPLHILAISAKTDQALRDLSGKYSRFLAANPEIPIADICFSAAVVRSHFEHRLAITAETSEEFGERLDAFIEGESSASATNGEVVNKRPKIAFLFTGQGSQYRGMGKELYDSQPVFRGALDKCADILAPYLKKSLLEVIFADSGDDLDNTAYTQPALFALEYSLFQVWKSWGVEPRAVMGHSVGEYVAACVAGALSLEDGLKLIAARGRLMAELPESGAMASVMAPKEQVEKIIEPYLKEISIAAFNGPDSIVISGRAKTVDGACELLKAEGVKKIKPLQVSHAFHSPLMEPMLENLRQELQTINFSKPRLNLISNLSGEIAGSEIGAPEYWLRHTREPVGFLNSMRTLEEQNCEIFIECGPKPILLGMGRRCLPKHKGLWLPSLREAGEDWSRMLSTLAKLHVCGASVDWAGFDRGYQRQKVVLPNYAWQKERYWIDLPKISPEQSLPGDSLHPLLGRKLMAAAQQEGVSFESWISPDSLPYLNDHRIFESVVFPGAAFLESALAAGSVYFQSDQLELYNITIQRALALPEDKPKRVQVVLNPSQEPDQAEFKIFSLTEEDSEEARWTTHISGLIKLRDPTIPEKIDLAAMKAVCDKRADIDEFYQSFAHRQIDYGRSFRGVKELWLGERESLSRLELDDELLSGINEYFIPPPLLDAVFQTAASILPSETNGTYLPVGMDRAIFYQSPQNSMWCRACIEQNIDLDGEALKIKELRLFTSDGDLAADIKDFLVRKVDPAALSRDINPWKNWLYQTDWILKEREEQEMLLVSKPRHWLILADKSGIGRALADSLKERSSVCSLVFAGENYQRLNEYEFMLNPKNPDDFERLLKELGRNVSEEKAGGLEVRSIAHLWSMDDLTQEDASGEDLSEASKSGCLSLLWLTQALLKAGFAKPPSLWLVTQNSQAVLSGSWLSMSQASLWGMGRTIAMEQPKLLAGMIDLEAGRPSELAASLLKEILNPDDENHIALRNGRRYAARLVKSQPLAKTESIAFEAEASYLISGGLGGLGLKTAQWMAEQGAGHLVLLGRGGLTDDNKNAISAIEQMKQAGAKVTTAKADVADRAALKEAMEMIQTSAPPLKGIIHSAGVIDDNTLPRLSPKQFDKVMAPKVSGAWNLHNLTKDSALDFFVCFSSIASLLGSPGQANYAAANAFMDSLTHRRQSLGLAATSINWGPWAEVGMASGLDKADQDRVGRVMKYMPPEQGLLVMEQILLTDAPQVGVMSVNWPAYLRQFASEKIPPFFHEQKAKVKFKPQKKSNVLQELKNASDEERREILVKYLQTQIAAALGLGSKTPDPRKDFAELGMDSLITAEFKNQIEFDLECFLDESAIFETPTAEALAGYLVDQVMNQPEKASDSEEEEADVDQLSDEEVELLLKRSLEEL